MLNIEQRQDPCSFLSSHHARRECRGRVPSHLIVGRVQTVHGVADGENDRTRYPHA